MIVKCLCKMFSDRMKMTDTEGTIKALKSVRSLEEVQGNTLERREYLDKLLSGTNPDRPTDPRDPLVQRKEKKESKEGNTDGTRGIQGGLRVEEGAGGDGQKKKWLLSDAVLDLDTFRSVKNRRIAR